MTSPLIPCDLHCEYRECPLGIDIAAPRFGWAFSGGGRAAKQGAYRIRVGTAPGLGDAWDPGFVSGDLQMHLVYAGRPLAGRTRYHWQVQVRDAAGSEGPWSAPAWFETAFLDVAQFAGDWLGAKPIADEERIALARARWVRPAVAHGQELSFYTTTVTLPKDVQVRRARMQVLADGSDSPWSCGVYKFLSVNGVRPDTAGNLPRQCLQEFELTPLLKAGENRVCFKSFSYADSAFIANLEVELSDGTLISRPTGAPEWRCRGSAKADHDATWDAADAAWQDTTAIAEFGAGPWPADDKRNRADRLVPALVLHRGFAAAKAIARARIYATALGTYELTLNGAPVGDRELAPGWTDYAKRIHYQTYDVTAQIRSGANLLAATVGDGWWCGTLAPPFGAGFYGADKALKLALHLDYADGTSEIVATTPGQEWQAGTGPVRVADLLQGQLIDLTRETSAWRTTVVRAAPAGVLQAQPDEPIRRLMELPVRSLVEKKPGTYVLDFGQNLVGRIRLKMRAPRGTRIAVRHAEVLDLAGDVWTVNLRSALATDEFVCSGGDDVFDPSHTFHGFRYAEINGLPGGLRPEQVVAVVIGSDTADRGTFTCDNPQLNRLQANIRWGQRGNFVSIPTDCPQRDERLGWTADTQVFARTAVFNADCAAFYGKYVTDMLDSQHPAGGFAHFAPTHELTEHGAYGWADAGVVMPWTLWRSYGDTDVIDRAWDGMRRYVDNRDRHAVNDLNTQWSFGDWVSPLPQTPNDVLGPIYHGWMHRLMAEMAEATGKAADATHHRSRFAAIGAAWRAKHLDANGRIHTSDTQAAYACAIRAGLIPDDLLAKVAPWFVRSVERHTWHLNTGFLGTYCLLPALTQVGRDDVAWRILLQDTFPGWLYTVKNGATTMWERWNTYSPETGPVNVGNMNSYNHYAFGAVGEWMYGTILGIDRAEDDIAFQKLVIRPVPGGCAKHARGEYRSLRGVIRSAWSIQDGCFSLEVTVPANCTAEVHVPTGQGATAVTHDGATALRDTATHAVFTVGAGEWRFSAPA